SACLAGPRRRGRREAKIAYSSLRTTLPLLCGPVVWCGAVLRNQKNGDLFVNFVLLYSFFCELFQRGSRVGTVCCWIFVLFLFRRVWLWFRFRLATTHRSVFGCGRG
ncbi:unnamed protein product, partial [Ectocarpus sp. 12 AP-2014]